MIFHKIFKYASLLICLITAGFFIYTMVTGDTAIQEEAAIENNDGSLQNSTITPLIYLAYIILGLIVALVLFFVLKGVFSSADTLKRSLVSVGIMLVVCLIAYFVFADDSILDPISKEKIMLSDGEELTTGDSKLIGASLWTFYITAILAIASILWAGVSKLLKK